MPAQVCNPRKRPAEDDLVPTHSPKHPRTSSLSGELSARWIRVSWEAMGLFRDTGAALFGAIYDYLTPRSQSYTLPTTAPRPRPAYPISPPASPSKSPQQQAALPIPAAFAPSSSKSKASLPTPPLSDKHSDNSSNEAGPSNPRRPTTSQLPPPPRRQPSKQLARPNEPPQAEEYSKTHLLPTPPPSEPSAPSLSPPPTFIGLPPQLDRDLTALLQRPAKPKPLTKKFTHRPHIFHKQFKASVKDQLQKTREDMVKHLYLIHRKTGAFSSSLNEFQGWLGYRERLEGLQKVEVLAPSPAATDLRDADPPIARSPSNPVASMAYIQRAFRDARKSLVTPKPAVFTPTLSRLRTTKEQQSAQIDARIRPKRPSLPASLPPAADAEVDALLRKRGVISKCEREQVSDKDLARLRPGQWLNDEVINFYGQMIMCRAEEGKENRREGLWDAHYFSTFFWSKLKNEGYEKGRLAKWTKKFDLFSKDIILIPVNHNNSHWTSAAINFKKKRIESYDSMDMDRSTVYKHLRGYLDAEHQNKKKKPFNFEGWVDWSLEDTPQQENGYDCGVFTCQFLESLARGEENFVFTQENMTYLRRRMIWEIGHARLRDDA